MDPLVSVSVVTYNHGPYIAQCLESVLAQRTSFFFEVLIGEDGSTDNTLGICETYANRFPEKIRLIRHNRQKILVIDGVSTGRYNALNNLRNARGKYLAFCEGDDYWIDKQKLQIQVDFLETHPEVTGVFHDVLMVRQNGEIIGPIVGDKAIIAQPDIVDLIIQRYIATNAVMMRNCLTWYPPPELLLQTVNMDAALALLVAEMGSWVYLPRLMSAYRVHAAGIWSGAGREFKILQKLKLYGLYARTGKGADGRRAAAWRYKVLQRELAILKARQGEFRASVGPMLKSLGCGSLRGHRPRSLGVYAKAALRGLLRPRANRVKPPSE